MMMDDERNRRDFDEARADCLLRSKKKCHLMKGYPCLESKPECCPLWVFVKKITKPSYGR